MGWFYLMMDREVIHVPDINEIQKAVIPIARFYGVKRLYLFGSYAKGVADEESDIDLLIEKGRPMPLLKLSGMRQMVQEALDRSVDLVTMAGIGEDLREEIAGTEILLYEE
jgi:predicted nucleotidyltransferase